jgi:transcriptional regulator with XRE-family HTH domain
MTTTDNMPNKVHEGRNIKRFREMLGIKQDTLAQELGEDWTQSKVSHLETRDTIDPSILEQVAAVLKVPVEAIKNFDEEAAVNYINTFNDNSFSHANGTFHATNCTFNPIDKIVQLYDEKIALYERMLKEKDELIEKMLAKKK